MFRIHPSVPITWRSASCIQFGVDDPVLIDGLLPSDVALLEELRLGLGSAQYYSRAQDLGVDLSRASSLISLLDEAGVMIPQDSATGPLGGSSHQFGTAPLFRLSPDRTAALLAARPVMVTGPLRGAVEQHLGSSGFVIAPGSRIDELELFRSPVVIATSHLVPDLHSATWLTDREVPQIEVVVGERFVEVSGLIRPGLTPCTMCACLHRKDLDADWLDQYSRIRELPSRAELADPLSRGIGALHAVTLLRRALLQSESPAVRRRVDLVSGSCEDAQLDFHPRCPCRAPVPHFDLVAEQAQ
ncbi:hypothetical protein DFO66_103257 [Brevibacterium sanguinis]|uniref:Bacteriocin biosynthesis cyclodehydratase domain-containing protein n=2 Tax=Brevibacterium TaxID=1696 RepID=A0A366IKK4_9MICO|nr:MULTISPECIES: hypothetical protein [Brevibacterium]RBP66313.1 hypothetical protein DFO66_103257 [Brevibacterium sanguinis]RBP72964.1 hypothetical protein DFO65_103256 [Brevibacterium celere]